MRRHILACGLLLACAAVAPAEDRATPESSEARAKLLLTQLGRRFTLEKGIDPNTPLKDAVEFISDKFEVPIVIESQAFRAKGIPEVETQPVRLPRLRNIRLSGLLRLLLDQVNATYLIRDDYVQIVPLPTVPGGGPEVDRSALPLVYAIFEKRPLDDALHELADQVDSSVVLDANRAAEKAKAPVTATFKNVGVDTAVRLLADMTGLKMVRVDNVLYVTTPEGASEVEQAKPEGKSKKKAPQAPGGSEARPPAKK
jgi:hypothetical protein